MNEKKNLNNTERDGKTMSGDWSEARKFTPAMRIRPFYKFNLSSTNCSPPILI